MQIGLAEFLNKVSKLKKHEEKVEALRFNDSKPLRVVLQAIFDPNVKWLLPEGKVPYTPSSLLDIQHIFINECNNDKLWYYLEGFQEFYPNMTQHKREKMFIETLESIDPEDAKLLIAMKDKKCPYKGLTVDHVRAAIPDLYDFDSYVEPNTETLTETNEVEKEDE